MSLDEFNSLSAVNYELSSKANEIRLYSAINNFSNGNSFYKELIENEIYICK